MNKISLKPILCTVFCSGLAYMMQWEKGGGPNCAIENLAKCNNPRDLPHNSDLIKCNWDLAMALARLPGYLGRIQTPKACNSMSHWGQL